MASQQNQEYYIHPLREFTEYVCFLYAILDDTDLLTKVSLRDLECVAQILNRLKSLSLKKEVEIIHFDDIPRDSKFVKNAAQRILQQEDMYSLYKTIYSYREKEVEANLELCLKKEPSNIFNDTKEQNGCARVGQTKMFASNFPYFQKHLDQIRTIWLNTSKEVNQEKKEIDLHLHMISTIASAEEVYRNQIGPYTHQDELWIWTPPSPRGYNHLNHFLSGFKNGAKDFQKSISIEFLGNLPEEFVKILTQHFPEAPVKKSSSESSLAVLKFSPGKVNSRKSMISPFLPRLIS